MADDVITIHAARAVVDAAIAWEKSLSAYNRENARGATEALVVAVTNLGVKPPVRIVTTDPGWDGVPKAWTEGYAAGRAEALDEEGATLDAVRVGLDAEQEIRARAAALLLTDRAGRILDWKLGDWCAWVRDGSVPDAV